MKAPVSAGWLAMLVANLAKHYLLDPSLELAETACLLEYRRSEFLLPCLASGEPLPPNLRKFDRPDYPKDGSLFHRRFRPNG